MKYKIISALMASFFLLISPSWAAAQWQADVSVEWVDFQVQGQDWVCYATIKNTWDDDARKAQATILVPVGTQVWHAATSNGGRCAANPLQFGNTHSYVTCELGNIHVNHAVSIKVAGSFPQNGVNKQCGVFVRSETPDPKHDNNYAVSP